MACISVNVGIGVGIGIGNFFWHWCYMSKSLLYLYILMFFVKDNCELQDNDKQTVEVAVFYRFKLQ